MLFINRDKLFIGGSSFCDVIFVRGVAENVTKGRGPKKKAKICVTYFINGSYNIIMNKKVKIIKFELSTFLRPINNYFYRTIINY